MRFLSIIKKCFCICKTFTDDILFLFLQNPLFFVRCFVVEEQRLRASSRVTSLRNYYRCMQRPQTDQRQQGACRCKKRINEQHCEEATQLLNEGEKEICSRFLVLSFTCARTILAFGHKWAVHLFLIEGPVWGTLGVLKTLTATSSIAVPVPT